MRVSSIRRMASASLVALAVSSLPAVAVAQDAAPEISDPLPEAGPDSAADVGEAIIVTGSRIARPTLSSANPITSVDSEALQLSGETNLTNYLREIPSLVGSFDSTQTSGSAANAFIGSTGLSLLNLRNLGIERTLVLVDGRRHVSQLPETAAVDIGTIPQDLIDRIDVATGGVSAVYGADAVSGVVNFIMKKDFEGITGRVQAGFADQGEPLNWTASLAAGHNFADARGNIAIAYQYTRDGRLRARDRAYLRGNGYCTMQQNNDDPTDDPSLPDEVPVCGAQFFDSSREGAIDVDFDFFPDFRPNGDPYDIGEFIPPFYSVGGDGTLRGDYIGDLIARDDRHVVDLFLNYEFSPAARFFGEVKYARSEAFSESQPTFDYSVIINPDNPFIPGVIQPLAPDGLMLARDNFDLGVRGERNKRETWRSVVGLDGDLTDWLKYELSYVYGQSKVRSVSTNNRFNDRFFAAIDVVTDPATGRPTCRTNLDPTALMDQPLYNFGQAPFFYGDLAALSFTPGANSGCRPLNLFGEGVADPAAIDWIMTDSLATSRITQNVVTGFLSGQVPGFELPGGAIGFVVGAEYRKETSRSTPPPEDTAGQTFGNVIFPVRGDFDVTEAFAEVRVPILSDRPFFEELELNGAIRYSDYSTIGGATTYNVGARWAPVRDISFRGTYAQTVRAPNISELFSPESQTFEFIDDPCDINNVNNGSQFREANCAALLSGFGIDPTTYVDPNSASVPGFQRGNTALSEETSKSWTAGTVLRPSFIPGLTVTVDWYDIKIEDAISTAFAEDVVELCVDQPTLDNVFCDTVARSPTTGGVISYVVQPENVANFRTSGLDFDVNYRLDPATLGAGDIGTFNFRLFGNYLDRLTLIPTLGADIDDERTEQYAPKWQASFDLTWVKGPWTVNYGFNYFSKTKRYENEELAGDPDLASPENINFDARHTHDVQVGYRFAAPFMVYAGVNNIGNQKPDLDTIYPVSPVGRFFYMGARVNLPGL